MKQNETTARAPLKPMPLYQSLLLFGVPGILIYVLMYYGVPVLIEWGIPLVYAMPILMPIVGIMLIPLSILLIRREGTGLTWKGIKERLRIRPIKGGEWLIVAAVFLFCLVADESLQFIGKWMAAIPLFAPPAYFSSASAPLNPLAELRFPITDFMGAPIKGNWTILLVWLPLNLLSMIGEELMWRGYILPRQEARHGRWAFILNGLLWAFLVHACMKWNYISMIPSMVATPWVAQRLKNTTASMFVHIFGNIVLFFAFLLIGILGIGA